MSNKTGLRALAGALLVAAASVYGAGVALSQEWKPEFVDGKLQPLPDGFPNQDITLIVADDPSSAEGILMQNLVETASKYAPVSIRAEAREDFASYGSWEALKYASDAEGGADGYINIIFGIPGGIVDLHAATVQKDIGVSLDSLAEVITLESRPYALIQCASAPWEPTWQALLDQIKANPGKVRYMGGGPGAGTDVAFAYYLHKLGIGSLYDKSVIDYVDVGNPSSCALATAACEGDITFAPMDLAYTHSQAGKVKVLLIGQDKRIEQFPDVPTAAEVGIPDDPVSSTKQIIVPSAVDPQHVQWLYALWNAVASDPDYQAKRRQIQVGTQIKNLDPAASAALNDATDAKMDELTHLLGINVD